MSYDVGLYGPEEKRDCICAECGDEHTKVVRHEYYSANMTSNVARMWEHAGLDLDQHAYDKGYRVTGAEFKPQVAAAIERVCANPNIYRAMEPANGWGSYRGTVDFLRHLLTACELYPDAVVWVSN